MEIWKDVVGYEGLYKVSNTGKIKTLQGKSKRLLGSRKDKYGYIIYTLYKNGTRKDYKAHRLVAMAFIPNPQNLPQVNHKNEIKDCNYVENLEWCTSSYNVHYGTSIQRRSEKQRGKPRPSSQGKNNYFYGKHFIGGDHPQAKKVEQYTKNGVYLKTYDSVSTASRYLNINGTGICFCANGKRKSAGGYVWKYTKESLLGSQ